MGVIISGVEPGSHAGEQGFQAGDTLLRINGNDVADVLDYRFHMTSPHLVLEGTGKDGAPFRREVRKGEYDDLGLLFDTFLMDKQRPCRNKCVFCFIDQLPRGMRDSLYFKDDDSRMSFLFGNYVTLTNLEDRDIRRILDMRISPVNVSVHTTNPDLRVSMMKNPRAGQVLDYIPRLTVAGIDVNAQLVLCPGLNDRGELERSLTDLCTLGSHLRSVAVVPVGLTRHREGLPALRLFTREEARGVVATVNRFGEGMLRDHGRRTCFAADEFYLAAGFPLPEASHYEDFDQLENGVGLWALLLDEFRAALALEDPVPITRRVTLATGVAAAPLLETLARLAADRFPGLSIRVEAVPNDFLGRTITVAGLLTGGDLLGHLHSLNLGEELLLPAVTLRRERDLFLDGLSPEDLERKLGIPVRMVENDGFQLLDAFLGRAPS